MQNRSLCAEKKIRDTINAEDIIIAYHADADAHRTTKSILRYAAGRAKQPLAGVLNLCAGCLHVLSAREEILDKHLLENQAFKDSIVAFKRCYLGSTIYL